MEQSQGRTAKLCGKALAVAKCREKPVRNKLNVLCHEILPVAAAAGANWTWSLVC